MKLTLVDVKNPVWVNEEHTLIDCDLIVKDLDFSLPFTASPDDIAEHGKEIFARLVAKEFGEISEFVPKVIN